MILGLVAGALTLMSTWEFGLDKQAVLAMAPSHQFQAFRIAGQSQLSQRWFTFAADWTKPTDWPKGQAISLALKDGRTLESSAVMAMTPFPEGRAILLGLEGRVLDPSELEHGRNGRVVLLVSFPDPNLGMGDIREVRLAQRVHADAAPSAQEPR